jgi:hypothetical protein
MNLLDSAASRSHWVADFREYGSEYLCFILESYLLNMRSVFQNEPPIGWLKKYKIENKTLLYGTITYVTALLLHIVAIHI